MKTKTQKVLSELMDEVKKYTEYQNMTNSKLDKMIEEVYENTIVNFKKGYNPKGKSLQDHEEYSDFVLSVADSKITTMLSSYALDNSTTPYNIPSEKMVKLKKHYARILIVSDKKYEGYNELFASLFYVSYIRSIQTAIANREQVLQEKKNKNKN